MWLLGLVPCCCRRVRIEESPPVIRPVKEEETPLSAGSGAKNRHRRARRGGSEAAHWRPSLGDINEDAATAAKSASAARLTASKTTGAPSRGLRRAHTDRYRHVETSTNMVAFTPTAFLF